MFASLGESLNRVFDKLRGRGVLTEENIAQALREIRIALLESDVALPVVKILIENIRVKAVGQEVLKSISPAHMVVKIVHDELVKILTSQNQALNLSAKPPAAFMLVGLQGAGKTTTTAKLALRLRNKHKKNVLLVSLDTVRPAAQKQLELLGKQINVDTLPIIEGEGAFKIVARALSQAQQKGYEVILFDTAGRTHINTELMQELKEIQRLTRPAETLFVVDSMLGQDSVNIAQEFHKYVELTGAILTKTDGDAKGGAALSICAITSCPVKLVGKGEKLNELEDFDPERTVSRILGMGDIVALVEKAVETVNEKEAEKMAAKIQKGIFDMNDLLAQLQTLRKMGGIGSVMGMIPGLGKIKQQLQSANIDEKLLSRQQAIIQSMTRQERKNPKLINGSRKQRIAKGSGTQIQEINKLVKQWLEMQNMVKRFGKMEGNKIDKMRKMLNIKF